MITKHLLLTTLLVTTYFSIIGCATTTTLTYRAAGEETLCTDNNNLGYVAILPEVAWRKDQKEPGKREEMAMEEIERSFTQLPCGNLSTPGGIREFSNWSNHAEHELLKDFSREGVDTVVLIRIEELSPRIFVTFSLPFLWGGTSEADFHVRALSVNTGAVLSDMRVKRFTGGPFNIRPAEWARVELNAALESIIENPE